MQTYAPQKNFRNLICSGFYHGLESTQCGFFLKRWHFFKSENFFKVRVIVKNLCLVPDRDYPLNPDPDLLKLIKIACSNLETVVGHNPGGALGHGSEFLAGRDRVHSLHTRHHRKQACSCTKYRKFRCRYKCCGSGSVSGLDPDSIGSVDPDPYSESGSGSRRAKMIHKHRKKVNKFHFFEVLDVLFWGLKASPVAWTKVNCNFFLSKTDNFLL